MVLQGLNHALDTPLGLRRVGTDDLKIQFLHGVSKLGNRWPGACTGLIDPKNAVLVVVECHRLAILPETAFCGLGIGMETFAVHEAQLEQFASGIVDEH